MFLVKPSKNISFYYIVNKLKKLEGNGVNTEHSEAIKSFLKIENYNNQVYFNSEMRHF